jgi:hypothetical protein
MSSNLRKIWGGFILAAVAAGANGQSWSLCIDPDNTAPYSNDFGFNSVANSLMRVTMGASGTVTYGGDGGPCFDPAITANAAGRIGFASGSQGSIQTAFDNNMLYTFGMPTDVAGTWGYACVVTADPETPTDLTKTTYGSTGFNILYAGASNRYIHSEADVDGVRVVCDIQQIGDGTRIRWRLTNTGDPQLVGLWFGQWIAMLASAPDPTTGTQASGGPIAQKGPYIVVPGHKPPIIQTRYIRSQLGATFPQYVEFNFGQSSAYGFKVDMGPSTAQNDGTQASEVVVGNGFFLLGNPDGGDGDMPDVILPDNFIPANLTGYIQKFNPISLGTNSARVVTQYFRNSWGQSNYSGLTQVAPGGSGTGYTATVDAPRLVSTDTDEAATETNGLFKNPFIIRAILDNVGGFGDVNNGLPQNQIAVTLTLPTGLNFVGFPPSTRSRTLNMATVNIIQLGSVDFNVEADGIENGDLPYSVRFSAVPGGVKTVNGTVRIAATKRYRLLDVGGAPTANGITTPFIFNDSSWETVLGLVSPTEFQAFAWNPQLKGYVISTSAARGHGVFIVNNTGNEISSPLGGDPQTPPGTTPNPGDNTATYIIQLKSGWNLIGNPFNYPITLGQLTAAVTGGTSGSWQDAVNAGAVNSTLAYWNVPTQSYRYVTGNSAQIMPNIAYWVFVRTAADVTLGFPPVFSPGLPGSSRAADEWTQSDKQWRLQLVARTERAADDQNFIGVASSTANANNLRIMEPPMAPTQDIALSSEASLNGELTRIAQNLSEKAGKQEFKVTVQSVKDGEVNLTWPNISTIPKNIRLRLVDVATNTSRDMRTSSGYAFQATANSTREFKIQMDLGQGTKAVIGNMLVTRSGRANNSPFNITYTLSAPATTTIRILGPSGKEVFTVTRGRADNAGENTATWNLKDNANRSVAPGTYRVEILATTAEGDNVRRIVPVNVIR